MEADNEQHVLILPDGSMAVATKIKKQENLEEKILQHMVVLQEVKLKD